MDKRKKNTKQSLGQHFFRFFFALFFLGWEESAFALVFRRLRRRFWGFEGGISVLIRLSNGLVSVLRRFGEALFFSGSLLPYLRSSSTGKAAGQADGGLEALEVLASGDFYGAELLGDGG